MEKHECILDEVGNLTRWPHCEDTGAQNYNCMIVLEYLNMIIVLYFDNLRLSFISTLRSIDMDTLNLITSSQFDNLSGISKEIVYPIIECLIFPHDPLSPPRVNKARSRLPVISAHVRGGQNRSFV